MSQLIIKDNKMLIGNNKALLVPTPPPKYFNLSVDASLVDATLTNFPLLIHIGGQSGISNLDTRAIFTEVGAASGKISVQLANGTELPVEVESWDTVNQEAYLWTKVPTVDATTNTALKLYYGSTRTVSPSVGVVGSTIAKTVWNSDHISVYHMSILTPQARILDSTSNMYEGTAINSPMFNSLTGVIDGAIQFNGIDEFIDLPPNKVGGLSTLSVFGWYKPYYIPNNTQFGDSQALISRWNGNQAYQYQFSLLSNGGFGVATNTTHAVVRVEAQSSQYHEIYDTSQIPLNQWTSIGFTFEKGVNFTLYKNGIQATGGNTSLVPLNSPIKNNTDLAYGPRIADSGAYALQGGVGRAYGIADEIRIYNKKLTPAEIKANYYCQDDNLVTFS